MSNFKVREGYETSAKVTLRRDRMWHFLDRLINLATPRIKDFRGVSDTAFDRQGNYSMGLNEQGVFPGGPPVPVRREDLPVPVKRPFLPNG